MGIGRRKLFPNLVVEEHLDNYTLQAIIWHHGFNMDSGHYTSMIRHNGNMYHLSDAQNVNCYDVRYGCTSNDYMVPYMLFYTKNDASITDIPLNVQTPNLTCSDPIDFTRLETSDSRPNKRKLEPTIEDLDQNTATKKQMVDKNLCTIEEIVIDQEEAPLNDVDEYIEEP